jgi:hypothetical protein
MRSLRERRKVDVWVVMVLPPTWITIQDLRPLAVHKACGVIFITLTYGEYSEKLQGISQSYAVPFK